MRPFRFSSPISGITSRRELRDHARKLEDLGYDTLTVSDHFDHHANQLAPLPSVVAAAEATTTLKVATLVLCNDFRHPVVLAKEAATVDLLLEGRFELGLGAGWMRTDYEQSGIPEDPAGVRIARLEESVRVLKGLFSAEAASFAGEHYRVTDLPGTPRPSSTGGPPLIIGGGGRKVLTLAGRYADIVGLNPSLPNGVFDESAGPSATPAATDRKLEWLRAAAGQRFGALELHCRLEAAVVSDDRRGLLEALAPAFGVSPDDASESPHALVGTHDEMIEQLRRNRERWGISYIGVPTSAIDDLAPVVAELRGT